jgi:hypothetical protein
MHESYGAAESDIGVAVGMHGRGLVHLVSQPAWDDLGLMEWLAPQLNGAEAAALKAGVGTFASASAASVVELRARRSIPGVPRDDREVGAARGLAEGRDAGGCASLRFTRVDAKCPDDRVDANTLVLPRVAFRPGSKSRTETFVTADAAGRRERGVPLGASV